VIAAACRVDGLIFTLPPPARHPDVLYAIYDLCRVRVGPKDQAFLLSDGTFAERTEAAQIALAAGQVEKLAAPPNLFSEDLW